MTYLWDNKHGEQMKSIAAYQQALEAGSLKLYNNARRLAEAIRIHPDATDFHKDVIAKGIKWGSLTEKQAYYMAKFAFEKGIKLNAADVPADNFVEEVVEAVEASVESTPDMIIEFVGDETAEEWAPIFTGDKRSPHKFDRPRRVQVVGNSVHVWGCSNNFDFQVERALDTDVKLHVGRALHLSMLDAMSNTRIEMRQAQFAAAGLVR